jgi:hypothetical protein
MTILEHLRSNPYLGMPSNEPTCGSLDFAWDGGYFVRCQKCGRVGPVPILLHIPHSPPIVKPMDTLPIFNGMMKLVAKLLPF